MMDNTIVHLFMLDAGHRGNLAARAPPKPRLEGCTQKGLTTLERTYVVAGMTCSHCEMSVKEEIEELPGVVTASADAATGRVVVHGEAVDDAAVRGAVEAAGYRLAS